MESGGAGPIKKRIFCFSFFLISVLTHITTSYANTGSVYGLGTIAPAMGNAYTAHPDDPSALYYNPAGLALEKKDQLLIGLTYFSPLIWVKGTFGAKNYIDNDRVIGLTVGLATNLGHMTGYRQLSRISTGFFLFTPPDRAYTVHAIPTSTLSFPLYKDTASQLMLLFGLGYRVSRYLQLGASILLVMPGQMTTSYYINPSSTSQSLNPIVLINRSLIISAAPEFGFIVKPLKKFAFGAVYRQKNSSGLHGSTGFIINGQPYISEIDYEKVFTTPDQIAGGVSITPVNNLRINADVTYSVWSDKSVTDTQGNSFTANDTISASVGVEYKPTQEWAVRGGYTYSPSPFPPQTGTTNYMDSDKSIYSIGGGYNFGWFKTDIKSCINVFIQMQQLKERNNNSQLLSLGYSDGGDVWSSGISISFRL